MENEHAKTELYKKRLIKLGLKVAYYRKLRGDMSVQQLADKAQISENLIWKLEGPGTAQSVSLKTLYAIADALEVAPYQLIEE